MSSHSPERKAAIIRKLLPPQLTVAEFSRQEGIVPVTLHAWRTKLKAGGALMPKDKNNADDWPTEAKFAAALHAATLSEIELSEYCLSKGLYPEQIRVWRQGQMSAKAQLKAEREQARADKKRIAGAGARTVA
jgi:transposase-like protein